MYETFITYSTKSLWHVQMSCDRFLRFRRITNYMYHSYELMGYVMVLTETKLLWRKSCSDSWRDCRMLNLIGQEACSVCRRLIWRRFSGYHLPSPNLWSVVILASSRQWENELCWLMYAWNVLWRIWPLLGNGSVNTFPSVTLSTIEGRPLLRNRSLDTFPQQWINTNHR
jgi:hypothetical protein